MEGILTKYFEDRKAAIASHFIVRPENNDETTEVVKAVKNKELCKHGEYPADCDKCNPVDLEKDEEGESDDMEASVEKAFDDVLEKGGKGSNKAGRVIGTTSSGKPINVFKEAHEYKDFEPKDHEEAYKHHLNHANKVQGVAGINSRIRAHDHGDQAKIKALKKEQDELTEKNGKMKKENQAADKAKQMKATAKPKAKAKSKVQKAFDNILEKSHILGSFEPPTIKAINFLIKKQSDEADTALDDILTKGTIFSSFTSSYGSNNKMEFQKTGKEISKKLLIQAVALSAIESNLLAKMAVIEAEVGTAPDSTNKSYSLETLSVKRYSWDFCNVSCSDPVESAYMGINKIATEPTDAQKTTRQLCNTYNDLSYQLLSTMEDLEAIRIIVDSMEAGKKYNLSIGQLATLGF